MADNTNAGPNTSTSDVHISTDITQEQLYKIVTGLYGILGGADVSPDQKIDDDEKTQLINSILNLLSQYIYKPSPGIVIDPNEQSYGLLQIKKGNNGPAFSLDYLRNAASLALSQANTANNRVNNILVDLDSKANKEHKHLPTDIQGSGILTVNQINNKLYQSINTTVSAAKAGQTTEDGTIYNGLSSVGWVNHNAFRILDNDNAVIANVRMRAHSDGRVGLQFYINDPFGSQRNIYLGLYTNSKNDTSTFEIGGTDGKSTFYKGLINSDAEKESFSQQLHPAPRNSGIRNGRSSVINLTTSDYSQDITIPFIASNASETAKKPTYSSAPTVVVSLYSTELAANNQTDAETASGLTAVVTNVTKDEFKVRIFNAKKKAVKVYVDWIAVSSAYSY